MNIEKTKAYKHRESRFNALFPKRIEKSITSIHSIKKLSNKTNYVYDSKQIYEGLTLIINELNSVFTSFGLDNVDDTSNQNIYSEIKDIKRELTELKIKMQHNEWK
jgi:molecular chaperone GrpE (heat shock protein)